MVESDIVITGSVTVELLVLSIFSCLSELFIIFMQKAREIVSSMTMILPESNECYGIRDPHRNQDGGYTM